LKGSPWAEWIDGSGQHRQEPDDIENRHGVGDSSAIHNPQIDRHFLPERLRQE
jgi:hypothetical protein